ncbi:hypothetical protein LCGC14_1493040 [marine sediment metagenome]|uniref:Uncharacterized protein n=1 Tax=marine sediment metagenome TaxID=412755 RepID=A0A0F9JS60_9ZZZZ|nr:hypothetical protein [Porticoccus sp.]
MLPNLNPAWSVHAAGEQTSVGAVAALAPRSKNIVSIIRDGAGEYIITMDTPLGMNDGVMIVTPVFVAGVVIAQPILETPVIDLTRRFIVIVDGVLGGLDAAFKFVLFRYNAP